MNNKQVDALTRSFGEILSQTLSQTKRSGDIKNRQVIKDSTIRDYQRAVDIKASFMRPAILNESVPFWRPAIFE